jgi:hypothetical protein
MRREDPELMLIGAARLIAPKGTSRLSASVWAGIAACTLLDPAPDLLENWVARLETELKVTDAHRQAMADRAVAAMESSADRRRRKLEEARRASRLQLPVRDEALSTEIEGKISAAVAARSEAEGLRAFAALPGKQGKETRRAIKRLEQTAKNLDDQVLKLREQARAQDAWGEAKASILLARARGEDVDVGEAETAEPALDENGARLIDKGRAVMIYGREIRARKLTGIDHALAEGSLGAVEGEEADRLYRIGLTYQEVYAIAEGQSTRGSGAEGGGGSGGPPAPQPRQMEAALKLLTMRRHLSERQRRVLDLVCGQQLKVREATVVYRDSKGRGAGFPATERALVLGLKVAAQALAASEMSGSIQLRVRKVMAAHRVISKVRA